MRVNSERYVVVGGGPVEAAAPGLRVGTAYGPARPGAGGGRHCRAC